VANPTYEQVSAGGTGHVEAVKVIYDPSKITYEQLLENVAALDDIDGILFVFVAFGTIADEVPVRVAQHVKAVSARTGKPISYAFLGWPETLEASRAAVQWPVFSTVEEAVAALALARERCACVAALRGRDETPWLTSTEPAPPAERDPPEPGRNVRLEECLALLEQHGLPMVETRIATDPQEAARFANTLGYPVAVKVLADEVVHKSDLGGVELDLQTEAEVRRACARIAARVAGAGATMRGYAVQAMAEPGVEVIVGMRRDPAFGPVVVAGMGGTLVEVIRDVAIRVAPFDHDDAVREQRNAGRDIPLGNDPLDHRHRRLTRGGGSQSREHQQQHDAGDHCGASVSRERAV